MWADFGYSLRADRNGTTLLSFAQGKQQISFDGSFGADFTPGPVHIVLVFVASTKTANTYLNGVLIRTAVVDINIPLTSNGCFIGKNVYGPTAKSLGVRIEELYTWRGELFAEEVLDRFNAGRDFSSILLPSFLTSSTQSIEVQFYATAVQKVAVNFFGGLYRRVRMFGPETEFSIASMDNICMYSKKVQLVNQMSSAEIVLPAMNYVVTMMSDPTAPTYADSVCPSESTCFCAESKSPRQYLMDSGTLSQTLLIANNVTTWQTQQLDFMYLSALCFELAGSSKFATNEGDSSVVTGETCFPASTLRMNREETVSVSIRVFELYPPITPDMAAVFETYVDATTIYVSDRVSGIPEVQTLEYDPRSPGTYYTIKAGEPQTSAPYVHGFDVEVQRNSPDGGSLVKASWFIPVLGAVPNEVPDYFPVATDPTLIYFILRDPPGGGSFASVRAGTQVQFDMSIDGMHTYSASKSSLRSADVGVDVEISNELAPLGFGIGIKTVGVAVAAEGHSAGAQVASVERYSSAAYTYSMAFEYDFSTSTDPNIAGHPSDMIVGGGVDLIVSSAVEVLIGNTTDERYCIKSANAHMWQPGRMTTYILPVIEIEDLIRQLSRIVEDYEGRSSEEDTEIKVKIQKQILNWKTVLANYRAHNEDLTAMFTDDQAQFNNLAIQFQNWKNNRASAILTPPESAFSDVYKEMQTTFEKTLAECEDLSSIVVTSLPFKSEVCDDVKTNKWTDFWRSINGACDMPDTNFQSSLSDAGFMSTFCQHRIAAEASMIPGGLDSSGGDDSVFGFLKDSKKYVTFSANAPVSISRTSSVQDSITTSATFSVGSMKSSGGGIDSSISAAGVEIGFGVEGDKGKELAVSLGKSSGSSRSFERTVSIILNDNDLGDYFAVRITEDPVFGTPVFKTMGGQSKCPGETGTQRRQSGVSIYQIIHRCGTDRRSTCTAQTLKQGDIASFGVVIKNSSPTKDTVDYTLGFSALFDKHYSGSYSDSDSDGGCGFPGQRSGLVADFMETDLRQIPYNELIEVPFTVSSTSLCNKFTEIAVQIIATCEIPSSSSEVYQYAAVYDTTSRLVSINYDDSANYRAANSTAKFTVEWELPVSRRLAESEAELSTFLTQDRVMKYVVIVGAATIGAVAVYVLHLFYVESVFASKCKGSGFDRV